MRPCCEGQPERQRPHVASRSSSCTEIHLSRLGCSTIIWSAWNNGPLYQNCRRTSVSPGCRFCSWRGGVDSDEVSNEFSRVVVFRDVVPLRGHKLPLQASGHVHPIWLAYTRLQASSVYVYPCLECSSLPGTHAWASKNLKEPPQSPRTAACPLKGSAGRQTWRRWRSAAGGWSTPPCTPPWPNPSESASPASTHACRELCALTHACQPG